MGTLYVVSTPIGNLEDISLRALRVLKEASLIAAEDTRHTRKLLSHYGITTAAISYHAHNEDVRVAPILAQLELGDVALVSDAGTPGFSDPGRVLVAAALEAGYAVTTVPGPVAAVTALVISGFETTRFTFLGFLPRKESERRAVLATVSALRWPVVLYEAPHRLDDLLADLLAVFGDRHCAVARELTKLHEEVRRETLSEASAHFKANAPRGEFTVIVAGVAEVSADAQVSDEDAKLSEARLRLVSLVKAGSSPRDAVQRVAIELALTRRNVYNIWLELAAEQ